jgi:hypothetical protein
VPADIDGSLLCERAQLVTRQLAMQRARAWNASTELRPDDLQRGVDGLGVGASETAVECPKRPHPTRGGPHVAPKWSPGQLDLERGSVGLVDVEHEMDETLPPELVVRLQRYRRNEDRRRHSRLLQYRCRAVSSIRVRVVECQSDTSTRRTLLDVRQRHDVRSPSQARDLLGESLGMYR